MSIIAVTRHPGARAWLAEQGVEVDRLVDHLNVDEVGSGDMVVGALPAHVAADICSRGARYFHIVMELPAGLRGKELTADEMRRCGARLEEYRVEQLE